MSLERLNSHSLVSNVKYSSFCLKKNSQNSKFLIKCAHLDKNASFSHFSINELIDCFIGNKPIREKITDKALNLWLWHLILKPLSRDQTPSFF